MKPTSPQFLQKNRCDLSFDFKEQAVRRHAEQGHDQLLVARFPASSDLTELAGLMDPAAQAEVEHAFYRMTIAGMVQVLSEPVIVGPEISEQPRALAIARVDVAEGAELTTNQRHETVGLDPTARALLPALDGTNDHAALTAVLKAEPMSGRLTFSRDGKRSPSRMGWKT